jgi:Ca2+-binding EF-hand superfamily protein
VSHAALGSLTAIVLALTPNAALSQSRTAAAEQGAPLPRARFIADMDTEFRKMDADKNGQLTRLEIEQYQKLSALAQAEARNQALFAQLDADKSGQLSKAEFARLVTPPPPANAQPMLARKDGNRDNQISLVEHRAATLANFDRLDADKDGNVTAAEMKAGGIAPR